MDDAVKIEDDAPQAKPLRVMVVEDEPLVAMLLEDFLEELGCKAVGPAARAPQALKLIETETFDFVLLDLNLGGVKSYPIAEVLAARGVPFAFCTGQDGHDLLEPWRSRPVLVKPFRRADLERVLDAARALQN